MKLHEDISSCIGCTPIVRLKRSTRDAPALLLGKVEYLNPAGSLKDRVALAMVEAAEQDGRLTSGATIVEATAGNTGIGLALVAATRGYRFVAILSEADRGPKSRTMEALGAEVIFTPSGLAWDGPDGPCGVARNVADERDGLFLDQFANPANPRVHETTTAAEISAALGDDLDTVVVGVGTGGTVTGLARGLRVGGATMRVIGVAAEGSYLGSGKEGDRIAGITPDFAPPCLDESLLDDVEAVAADEALRAMERLNRVEGLPVGHSSGACLVVAEREARRRPGSTILFLLGDSVRNYR